MLGDKGNILLDDRVMPVPLDRSCPKNEVGLWSEERDFLRRDARTPWQEDFLAAGLPFTIATNYEPVLEIARKSLEPPPRPEIGSSPIRLRLWVDLSGHSAPPWPKPYFRGLDSLVFIGLDTRSSLLLDLRTRHALGRLTPEVASDPWLWNTIIFPVVLTAFAGAMGRPVVHCGCVAWEEKGLLLAGESGSGKSTLSLALAQAGFGFVSDDRTVLNLHDGRLLASGLGPCLKMRPEALPHFSRRESNGHASRLNGKDAIYLNPAEHFGVERRQGCEPQAIVRLIQQDAPAFSIQEVHSQDVALQLEAGLIQESAEAAREQARVMESLAGCRSFELRYGGNPHDIARALRTFFVDRIGNVPSQRPEISRRLFKPSALRNDPLRRFTATPLSVDFRLMRRHVRVETNCPAVLDSARRAIGRCGPASATLPDFVWRIISDPESPLVPPWPEMNAFSDRHRRYVNLGQNSFIAVDLSCREAVAFVSKGLVRDEPGFASIVFASLFYLSAGALGLTAVSSACIASEGKGLLLFGVPRSGKTTSCFMARGQGYEFHADQAVFLEMDEGAPRAWGEFWPAAFHADASAFVPGLAEFGRPFVHRSASYLCVEKNPSLHAAASSVVPVACIFLERKAADPPKLIPLSNSEFARILEQSVPFYDDSGSEESHRAARQALTKLPAFRLLYQGDPSTSSSFFRSLLSTHQVVECLG